MTAHEFLAELRADPAALEELRGLLGAAPAVYSCATLAAELGCTARAVRAAIERGDLAAVRSGRAWVIGAEAVAAWAAPAAAHSRRPRRGTAARPMRDAMARLDSDEWRKGT